MRVIGGDLGGRKLETLEGIHTRPPLEAVRQAVFNILANEIKGARVLDLFAGSGSVGIEALSRGAANVDFVESFRPAIKILKMNLDNLDLSERSRIIPGRLPEVLSNHQINQCTYDLVFIDPPFDDIMRGKFLKLEHEFRDLLHATSKVIVRLPENFPISSEDPYFDTYKERRYGISILLFRQLKMT